MHRHTKTSTSGRESLAAAVGPRPAGSWALGLGTGKLFRVRTDEEAFAVRFKLQRSNDPKQPFYFEIQAAGNYETLATSETYVSKADAQHAIDLIKSGAAGATVVDVT